VARILVRRGANQDVFSAAGLGNVVLLERTLKQDPSAANFRLADGMTPLHFAAINGELAAAKLLVEFGAAIDAQTSAGWGGPGDTPLHQASLRGKLEMCAWLIDHGADVNKDGPEGIPLHWAVFDDDRELAALLIARGSNLRLPGGPDGETPLHSAVRYGHLQMARLLLDFGADINLETGDPELRRDVPNYSADNRQLSPLDIAVESRKQAMAKFLVARGARLLCEPAERLDELLTSDDRPGARQP
jgi:ankyrin repeat protein